MKTKEYEAPECAIAVIVAEASLLLIASAGGAGEAGMINDPSDDFIFEL